MKTVLILMAIPIGIVVFFAILQFFSDRTYKPTPAEFAGKLQSMVDGTMHWGEYDELYSVRIAYDSHLEGIRQKLNQILDMPSTFNHPHSKTKAVDLSEDGKRRIEGLIQETMRAT